MGASYDAFIKQVSGAPDDIEACQKAFDDLATAYIYTLTDESGRNWMQSLTKETKKATVAFLEQKGVINALEIVDNALLQKETTLAEAKRAHAQICMELAQNVNSESDAKQIAMLESVNLDNVTQNELNTLITEAEQLGINTGALINLKAAKFDVGRQSLNLDDDVSGLLAMAKAAGIATSATVKLTSLLEGYKAASNEDAKRALARQLEAENQL